MSRCARCGAEIAIPGETCARCGHVSERCGPVALDPDPHAARDAPRRSRRAGGRSANNAAGPDGGPQAADDDGAMGWVTTVAVLLAAVLLVGALGLWVFGQRREQEVAGTPLVYPTTTTRRVPGTATTTIPPRHTTTTPVPTSLPDGAPVPSVPDPGAGSRPAAPWKHYASPDGALEADFPAAPTVSQLRDVTTCALSGNQVQQDDGQNVYLVTYGLTQPDCPDDQLTSELLHAAVGTLGPSGQVLNVRQGPFHTYTMTGFDLSAGANDVRGQGAVIVTPGHYFLVIAAGPVSSAVEFERFLSSLQVS